MRKQDNLLSSPPNSLLDKLCDFENLVCAYRLCSRGKRNSRDFQKSFFAMGDKLKRIQDSLASGKFKWGRYKEFFVYDPKKRIIMCAPFLDRVVHHAICQVIEPTLDALMPPCVYACRKGKGNRAAVIDLLAALDELGSNRFTMKLDVAKYFASIDHNVLLSKLRCCLSDRSLEPLIQSLLESHPEFRAAGKGVPIGNLSSQLFANFYLTSADEIGVRELGNGYFRYMDDMILIGKDKAVVLQATRTICEHIQGELLLNIPFQKRMPLGHDPVPFLGYTVGHRNTDSTSPKILARTKRRFAKKIKRQNAIGAAPSHIAQMELSFESWANLVYDKSKV